MTRVTLFDYGAGNLHSLGKALAGGDATIRIEEDPIAALDTDLLVLPGVGAFDTAAARLAPAREQVREAVLAGLPVLGICLGMQLLFEGSDEGTGTTPGLGIFRGRVRRLAGRRVPHMGWNTVEPVAGRAGEDEARLPAIAYFANSYVCVPEDPDAIVAMTTHDGEQFVAAVRRGNVTGVQFHPEKSSAAGVQFVRDVVRLAGMRATAGAR